MSSENGYSTGVKEHSALTKLMTYLIVGLATFLFLFPFYWMVVTAVKPVSEVFAYPPLLWPSEFHWENFLSVLQKYDFGIYFKNSTIVTVASTVITVFINLLGGYAFAVYKFKFKEFFFILVLSTLMIPVQVTMIPNFIIMSDIHWLNTYAGLVFPPCAEAFGLFLSRQFIAQLPHELMESGRIDGASEFCIFRRIMLPNTKSLISVLVIFTVMWRWNDFQWPLIVLSNSKMYTVQIGLSMLNGDAYVNWNMLMSAALISMVPVVIIFLIFQKQFVQGIAFTGIKG